MSKEVTRVRVFAPNGEIYIHSENIDCIKITFDISDGFPSVCITLPDKRTVEYNGMPFTLYKTV